VESDVERVEERFDEVGEDLEDREKEEKEE